MASNHPDIENRLSYFEQLFRRHYSFLLNYACKFVLHKSVAEDILQEIFMSMWINRETIDFDTRDIRPYLVRAVRNRCLKYIQAANQLVSIDSLNVDFLICKEALEQTDESVSVKDLENEIKKGINSLPPKCKEVFIYSRFHNMKNKEIALMLDISEKTVEKHIGRALVLLRKYLIDGGLLGLLCICKL